MSKPLPYTLRISRLTVDKLGVKLYDKASAVVSELIANSYDADATQVEVHIPLATLLGSEEAKDGAGNDYAIIVSDNGHGMSPEEAQAQVGWLICCSEAVDLREFGVTNGILRVQLL